MLFKVHADLGTGEKDFFEMNPGALAIEEFAGLTSKQMFCACLIADRDYDSPLRSLIEKRRREIAVKTAGYGFEDGGKRPDKNARNIINGKVESIEKAISKYRELQPDEDLQMLEALNAQIQETMMIMAMDKKESATVTKVRTLRNGETVETTYIDPAVLAKLTTEAAKLGARLPELKESKAKLIASIQKSAPIENIITYTADDLIEGAEPFENGDESDEAMSALDKYMEKKRNLKDEQSN